MIKDTAVSPNIGYSRKLMLLLGVLFASHSEVLVCVVESSEKLKGPVTKHQKMFE